jgi:hypothetical protein
MKTKLTDAVAFAGCDGRPEDAAGLRTRGVEIASTVLGVECGAGLIIAEILKSGNWIATFVDFEGAGGRIAGKVRGEARPGGSRTLLNAGGTVRVFMLEGGESLAEPEGVGRAYGKDSDAALGAAGAAEEMRAAARRGVGEGAVYKSDKRAVLPAKEHTGWIHVACEVRAHPLMVSLHEGDDIATRGMRDEPRHDWESCGMRPWRHSKRKPATPLAGNVRVGEIRS